MKKHFCLSSGVLNFSETSSNKHKKTVLNHIHKHMRDDFSDFAADAACSCQVNSRNNRSIDWPVTPIHVYSNFYHYAYVGSTMPSRGVEQFEVRTVHVLSNSTLTITLEIHSQVMTILDNLIDSVTITNNNRRSDRGRQFDFTVYTGRFIVATAITVVEKGAQRHIPSAFNASLCVPFTSN
jgi:hypothetical protein